MQAAASRWTDACLARLFVFPEKSGKSNLNPMNDISDKINDAESDTASHRRVWLCHTLGRFRPSGGDNGGDSPTSAGGATESAGAGWLRQLTHRAMACEFQLLFPLRRGESSVSSTADIEAGMAVFVRIDQLEEQLSYFRVTSELSQINAVASEMEFPVEEGLFGLIERALELSRATDGAVDITAAPLSELWRTARAAERIPTPAEIAETRRSVGFQYVELDPDRHTIRFTRPGMRMDLGCIGKGFTLDETAGLLTEAELPDFLYHGGYSSILARGGSASSGNSGGNSGTGTNDQTAPSETGGGGWRVGLRDPMRPERRIAELRLCDRAIGTSGAQLQFFRYRGRRYGHLLDPRTGYPPESRRAVTVVAPDATLADGLSTAFYVLSAAKIAEFCEKNADHYPGLAVLLVDTDRDGEREILEYGFRPGELRLATEEE